MVFLWVTPESISIFLNDFNYLYTKLALPPTQSTENIIMFNQKWMKWRILRARTIPLSSITYISLKYLSNIDSWNQINLISTKDHFETFDIKA